MVYVLGHLGIPCSSWYRKPKATSAKPGPKPLPLAGPDIDSIRSTAEQYPWWGYKRIAVVCRRAGLHVSNKLVYRVMKRFGLLQRRRPRKAELYQTAKLFELLPQKPNDLWQADITYIHIPGYGWWYAVTVIDYFSRFLLAIHLTNSYSAFEVNKAVDAAVAEAERIHGPLGCRPFLVTDNGPSFLARRFRSHIAELFSHVRINYRTPSQLGLLERFHCTLKDEEVYWRLYENPGHTRDCLGEFHQRYNTVRPHWALVPIDGGDPVTPFEVYTGAVQVRLPRWQKWAVAAKAKLEQLMQDDAAHRDAA